jgi:catechol 2,3-dioxygenase-like lactoylglutathione lyase family enzyme
MILNHVDLQVRDVQATVTFFETFFAFRLTTSRSSPAIAVLEGDRGVVLVLQRRKDEAPYPEGFHIGFLVDDVPTVVAFHARASDAGLHVSDVDRNSRGTMVYCRHDGITIEVSCRARPPVTALPA